MDKTIFIDWTFDIFIKAAAYVLVSIAAIVLFPTTMAAAEYLRHSSDLLNVANYFNNVRVLYVRSFSLKYTELTFDCYCPVAML